MICLSRQLFSTNSVGPEVRIYAVDCVITFSSLTELKLCQYSYWKRKGLQVAVTLHVYRGTLRQGYYFCGALFLSIICSNSAEA